MGTETGEIRYTFERIEKKFWMNAGQYGALLSRIGNELIDDEFGASEITNLYYDTPDFRLIRSSVERPLFKEKLRIRSYGIPQSDSPVYAEIKRKLNGVGYKRRIRIPFAQAKLLLLGNPVGSEDSQTESEILHFVWRYSPRPAVLLSYQRTGMYARSDPDLRLTFDRDLRFRTERPGEPDGQDMHPLLADDGAVLLEIKTRGAIPVWLSSALSELQIYQTPFSKVGACYTGFIAPMLRYAAHADR